MANTIRVHKKVLNLSSPMNSWTKPGTTKPYNVFTFTVNDDKVTRPDRRPLILMIRHNSDCAYFLFRLKTSNSKIKEHLEKGIKRRF